VIVRQLVICGILMAWSVALGQPSQQNWPHWRGPLGTGAAPEGNPPVNWSESTNIKFKVAIPGSGSATPIIWNDRIYLHTAIRTGGSPAQPAERPAGGRGGLSTGKPTVPYQFVLLCLDRLTGKTLWQKTLREEIPHEGHHPTHGFASGSPVTDGRHIYSFFGSRGLYCLDMDGNLLWQKDLGKMQTRNSFGEGATPALHGNTLVVNWDHEGEDFIAAFEASTGNELWRTPRDERTSWATPLILTHGGKPQVVVSATNRIRSYDLATGKQIWECAGMTDNVIPTPVLFNDMVLAVSGYRGNSAMAIRLGREGDLTGTDAIAWKHTRSTPYVPSPLLYGKRLYFLAGNTSVLTCLDAQTGKTLIDAHRIESMRDVYASPVGAGGRVYLVGRDGSCAVIKDADALEVLSTPKLDEGIDASPVVVGNDLYLRGQKHLYRIAE